MLDMWLDSRHPIFEFTSLDRREKVSMIASGRATD